MTTNGTVTIEMHPLDIAVLRHAMAVYTARAKHHLNNAPSDEKQAREWGVRNAERVSNKLDLLGAADVTMTTHD